MGFGLLTIQTEGRFPLQGIGNKYLEKKKQY